MSINVYIHLLEIFNESQTFPSKFLFLFLCLRHYLSPLFSSTIHDVFILYFHEFNIFHPSLYFLSLFIYILYTYHINILGVRAMEDTVLGDGWPRVSLIPVNPINRARPYFTVFLCSTNLSRHILFASKYHHYYHFYSLLPTNTHTHSPSSPLLRLSHYHANLYGIF